MTQQISTLSKLILEEASFTVEVQPEDTPIRGNLVVTGDDELDRKEEDTVLAESEWNPWAWCVVKLTGTWHGVSDSFYLGGVVCGGEDEFWHEIAPDMKHEIADTLASKILNLVSKVSDSGKAD